MAKPRALDVHFAELWLKDLRKRVRATEGENPQLLALGQFFTLHEAYRRWDRKAGEFRHAIAVLAVDHGVPMTKKAGLAATFITLAIPEIKTGVGSVWARLMNAVWSEQIDLREIQERGIHASLDALKGSRQPLPSTPLPPGRRDKDLRRGLPLTR